MTYDFRKIPGEYTDYSELAVNIDDKNKQQKADALMEQYGRTASVSPYNVALVPLGDDFRYDHDVEWDQQYTNYKKLIDFVNANKDRYRGAEIGFGTPSDFFRTLRERSDNRFPSLRGDFFVYSDVYTEGRAAYWSGYYTSRPYWKVLGRELESDLRAAEILYAMALNDAKRRELRTARLLERDYEKLIRARRNLAVFQHHDAITGTSKAFVMNDFALKLFEGVQNCASVQSFAVQCLMMSADGGAPPSARIVVPDGDRQTYDRPAYKLALNLDRSRSRNVVVFNSLGRRKTEPVKVLVSDPHVRVVDSDGTAVRHQINPVWNSSGGSGENGGPQPLTISKVRFELLFVATLEPLSLTTFTIERTPGREGLATVYCKNCAGHSAFTVNPMRLGDVQLENDHFQALFDGKTGLLTSVVDKSSGASHHVDITFAAYQSAQFHSGAYLFMPDPNLRDTEKRVLDDYPGPSTVLVTSGPVASEITVVYGLVTHTVRLYRGKGVEGRGLYVENVVDFGQPPKNRETEMFMRLSSGIDNGEPAVIYTDSNGFQMQKRVAVKRVGVEGNYFPVTTAAYIEDDRRRLTVLVNHAQGAAGWEPGRIELMLDRRTLYDDSRGLGEGVVDNKMTVTKYWILLEAVQQSDDRRRPRVSNPSLVAHHLSEGLLYPAGVFVVDAESEHHLRPRWSALDGRPMPCDVHLMNLRTVTDPVFQQFPSPSALMVLHRKGYDCRLNRGYRIPECLLRRDAGVFDADTVLAGFDRLEMVKTTLTGVRRLETVERLDQIEVAPMELSAINITFVV